MKTRKRFLSLLLAVTLCLSMLPVGVLAAENGKALQAGAGAIETDDTVYYGTGQRAWQALSTNGNGGTYSDGTNAVQADSALFLFLKSGLRQMWFDDYDSYSNVYQDSNLRKYLNNEDVETGWGSEMSGYVSGYFSEAEWANVLETTKTSSADTSLGGMDYSDPGLDGDRLFALSANELADYLGYTTNDPTSWTAGLGGTSDYWLRSACDDDSPRAGAVYSRGYPFDLYVDYNNVWVRPAFNLNLNSVLFTSAAVGGKSLGTMGTLSTIPEYTGNEWKLTLLDSNRSNFTASTEAETSVEVGYSDWSIPIKYSGAQTGDNEYVSVLLCDSNGDVLYYGNIAQNSASGTATLTIPSGLTVGNYTLKVFSEQCNGDYKTDYASAFQEISLTVTLPQEATPQASFTATGDNGGTLSNVDTSMKYSTDGGVNWNDVTGTSMELTGVTAANDVLVKRPGNGSTTSDSAVQTIEITQASQPTVSGADCTTSEQNDGKITGVDSTMEYKLSAASGWTDITGTEITGLSNGTYDVRVKASGTALASAAATVTIGTHTCVVQGAWQYDADEHWKLCACGAEVGRAAHSGGTATCTAQAVCTECGQPYGAVDLSNHTGTVVWSQTATTHKQVYNCCQTEVSAEESHNWENGKCTVCDYPCTHTGGTATCSQLAVCDLCGSEYGDYDADNHKAVSAWTQENGKHYHKCEYGCDTHLDEADCSGGEATCTSLAVCATCGNSYGAINPDNHTGEVVWTKTETTHSSKYSCCDTPVVTEEAHDWTNGVCAECGYECQHGGGTATCADKAVCDTCGEEYGEVNAANHTNLVKTEAKPATHTETGNIEYWYCDGCGKYFSNEAGTKEIALEDTVIPMIEHSADGTGWYFDETSHWNTCECGEKLNEATHTFEWVTDEEATATEAGLRHEECTVCGYEKAAVEIPATGTTEEPSEPSQPGETPSEPPKDNPDTDTTSPQTGDDSNIALWIGVMLAAGAALTGTAVYSRKRKHSR